jgi:hypothetical protein
MVLGGVRRAREMETRRACAVVLYSCIDDFVDGLVACDRLLRRVLIWLAAI